MKHGPDAFDTTFGPDNNVMGYDEANDYDKEVEKPENVQWDDESWKGFSKPFSELEKENMVQKLDEKELKGMIGN